MTPQPRKKTPIWLLLADHLLLLVSLLVVLLIRGQSIAGTFEQRHAWILILLGIHLFTALLLEKYRVDKDSSLKLLFRNILVTALVFGGIVSMMIVFLGYLGFPRILFFGTLMVATAVQLTAAFAYVILRSAKRKDDPYDEATFEALAKSTKPEPPSDPRSFVLVGDQMIHESIIEEVGEEGVEYLHKYAPLGEDSVVLSVNNRLNILNLPGRMQTIVNLERVNNHRYINKFFETVNFRLPPGGLYCGFAEPQELRKKRILRKFMPGLGHLVYVFHFICCRLAPKLPVLRKLYYCVTKGKKRVMSRAEILGRLYSCGFEVVDESYVGELFFFVARKVRSPYYDANPTYGPLIRLNRIGKDGKMIGVYKMRTMHPYSEYLQPYIHKINDLSETGKFQDDFRISTAGKVMRKLWIDELPMLINWLKGEMKLVGVRPLSRHYFSLYDKELQERRIKTKPGLVPPYYADLPQTFEEIQASEARYLEQYEKHPFRTDWKYFWKAFGNIVFRNARSG